MSPDDPVADLVKRTLSNLQTIDDLALEGKRAFEVTQMLNSMLSLLVVPREFGTVECIGKATVAPHVHADGIRQWRHGPVEFQLHELRRRPPQHLKKLLMGLRNSVAHANFRFQHESGGEISSLVFIKCARDGTPQWSATFHVSELRRFLLNLGDELIAARDYQLSHPITNAAAEAETTDLEINLPSSFVQRINRLVADGEVSSGGTSFWTRFRPSCATTRMSPQRDAWPRALPPQLLFASVRRQEYRIFWLCLERPLTPLSERL